jgi:hypothetical protein
MSRVWARRALAALLLSVALGVVSFFALPVLLIAAPDTPESEVILNLCSDPRSKADRYIAWLYREGVARKVVSISAQIAHDAYPADFMRDHLVTLGVRREDSESLRTPIFDCRRLAMVEIAKFLQARGFKRALLICPPEDSRHFNWLAAQIRARDGIEIAVAYAPEDYEELTAGWYNSHGKVQRLVNQAMSVALDQFYSECR